MTLIRDRLLIGTASFGSTYGIANREVLRPEQIAEIIREAGSHSVAGFDTAFDYLGSESSLSSARQGAFYTKLSNNISKPSFVQVMRSVSTSLQRLQREYVHGVSFHNSDPLLRFPRLAQESMDKLKELGVAKKWGVSVYDLEELAAILDVARPDFVQAPISAVDRRFLDPEILARLDETGVRLHARSLFLQGSLLAPLNELPDRLHELRPVIQHLRSYAADLNIELVDLLIGSVSSSARVSKIVVGANSLGQLDQILASCKRVEELPHGLFNLPDFSLGKSLIDPRSW